MFLALEDLNAVTTKKLKDFLIQNYITCAMLWRASIASNVLLLKSLNAFGPRRRNHEPPTASLVLNAKARTDILSCATGYLRNVLNASGFVRRIRFAMVCRFDPLDLALPSLS